MGWSLDEDGIRRALALDVDARYACAINMIREHDELWTLGRDDGWVLNTTSAGTSTIPIWPHARFAELEATGAWAGARPERIGLSDQWLDAGRAEWFRDNDLMLSVFLVGHSSMSTDYESFAEWLRGPRIGRYTGSRGSDTARDRKRATRSTHDLVEYISQGEIHLVLQRIPEELRTRLGRVRRYVCPDLRVLGSVTTRGRRDIELASNLPVRVSVGRYLHGGQSPDEFGAPALGQWPPWAVRRFLLYDVLLHELGHLQVIDAKAARVQRKYASETRAQEFADELRRTLYSESFDHPDPMHNAPLPDELSTVVLWERLDKVQRATLVRLALAAPHGDLTTLEELEPLTTQQREFLTRALQATR